jgi:hypothetical protein
MQITSSGPEFSIAILAAAATSGTIDTSEMIFWAVLYRRRGSKARPVLARAIMAREHRGSKLLSMDA